MFAELVTKETMALEYAEFECRVCGRRVFVPHPLRGEDVHADGRLYELTCSKGHTDTYDVSEIESVNAKPAGSLKVKRAAAAIG